MSGVQIPSFTITDENGTTWVASWDSKGNISYSGTDKDGNTVSGAPSADLIKKIREYGATFNNEQEPSPDEQKKENNNDKEEKSNSSATEKNPVLDNFLKKHPGLSSINYNSKTGKISFRFSSPNNAMGEEISKEDMESIRRYFQQFEKTDFTNDQPRGLIDKFKHDVKSLSQGFVKDLKNSSLKTWELLKETGKLPIRMASDFRKTCKLISQGKFRELRGRLALRVYDNLEAQGLLSDNMQQRAETIKARLGIKNRTKNPNFLAKLYGKQIRDMRALFNKLRGRDKNSQTIKTPTAGISSNNKGISR